MSATINNSPASGEPNSLWVWASPMAYPSLAASFILLAVALILRMPDFGNPDYHVDEEFYFLVADRMWHGAVPFVDIWDRKPVGLFLIYALLRPLSGDSLIAIQIAALICAWFTSTIVWTLACRQISPTKALLPATIYLFYLSVFGGGNAQSPVFYNLPMAGAAYLCLRAGETENPRQLNRLALSAMALAGLAIQIKYTALFEGLFFGLFLLWRASRLSSALAPILIRAFTWAMVALLPTFAALAYYALLGQSRAFFFANFLSIFLRTQLSPAYLEQLERFIIFGGLPLFLIAAVSAFGHLAIGRRRHRDSLFLLGWATAAIIGVCAIGNFYDHYALPMIAPLLVLSARFFDRLLPGTLAFVVLTYWTHLFMKPDPVAANQRARTTIFRLSAKAKPYLRHGPLYIWDGPSIFYVTTHSPPPTRFAYPDHLSNEVERSALGADTRAELAHILALRPAIIVTSSRKIVPDYNSDTAEMLAHALQHNYRFLDRRPEGWNQRDYILNVRADLCPNCPSAPNLPKSRGVDPRH